MIFSDKHASDACSDWVVDLGGSGSYKPDVEHDPEPFGTVTAYTVTDDIFRGLIYAPYGQVMLSGSKIASPGKERRVRLDT